MATNNYIENYQPEVKDSRGIKTKLPIYSYANSSTTPALVPFYETEQYFQGQTVASSYAVSTTIFVSDTVSGTYQLAAASVVFGTTSSSGTLQVEVATGTQAIGSGTNQLTGAMSLSGTANTTVNGVLVTTPTLITPGSRVNLIFAGTVTGLANATVNIVLQRVS